LKTILLPYQQTKKKLLIQNVAHHAHKTKLDFSVGSEFNFRNLHKECVVYNGFRSLEFEFIGPHLFRFRGFLRHVPLKEVAVAAHSASQFTQLNAEYMNKTPNSVRTFVCDYHTNINLIFLKYQRRNGNKKRPKLFVVYIDRKIAMLRFLLCENRSFRKCVKRTQTEVKIKQSCLALGKDAYGL